MKLPYNKDVMMRRRCVYKKATLLITRIHRLYTCKEIKHHMIVLSNAYVGVFHDTILEVGTGDYQHLIDKDTRVIDALGHIMVPGFIDMHMELSMLHRFDEQRILHETANLYMQHGVTTLYLNQATPVWQTPFFAYDILWKQHLKAGYPLIDVQSVLSNQKMKKRFCISGGYRSYDPLKTAQLLYLKNAIDPHLLLKAMTIFPAKCLQLKKTGVIDAGMIADLLLINVHHIEEMFSTLEEGLIYQVIKKGVRIYPNIII